MKVGPQHRWLRLDSARISVVTIATTAFVSSCGSQVGNATPSPSDGRCQATAASVHGWGEPNRHDDFDNPSLPGWHVYDAPGHAGNGRRTPDAVAVGDGQLTITGDASGNSGGMGWDAGQMYGRWEVCAKSPRSAPGYHSVLLLWPDAEDWPIGGEVDFMEAVQPSRRTVEGWLHYGRDDRRTGGVVASDAAEWHAWAVEWRPDRITMFVDAQQWWTTTDKALFPPRPMHLCLQVDNFGGDISAGGQQSVDWARQYSIR